MSSEEESTMPDMVTIRGTPLANAGDATPGAGARRGWTGRIAGEYGSRRGWLQCRLCRLLESCGAYRAERRIDWSRVRRLVFVCKGNICRSPYAQASASRAGLPASSFGLQAAAVAHPQAIEVAAQRGLDLSNHQPRHRDEYQALPGDLLVGMEPAHLHPLRALSTGGTTTLLGLWSSPPRPFLQDPYGLSPAYFARCFAIIDDAVAHIAGHMRTVHAGCR